ncbi:glycoside hydrolase family 9 protein [Streptomyces phaeochromogenes]|uniref:glycoside hydrolase family 9 protein n=1 Tax=Streptomyces phaeochromogenes TaxID=1923 RepID=UPI00225A6DB6|nr:glycoside hydrolase family 9 protein [Streptomyces phaeochromogenes]MCX5599349.1 glycoside hydrolase family 9 protein [Streptomyces phaeochromogenes]
MSHRARWGAVFLAPVLTVALGATPAHTAQAAAEPAYERVLNGTFDTVKSPWWSSANSPSAVSLGRLCADVPAGTVNPWDSMIGQNDIPLEAGRPYTLRFTASATRDVSIRAVVQLPAAPATLNKTVAVTTAPKSFQFTGTSTTAGLHAQLQFQQGGATQPFTLCLDDVSLTGGAIAPGGGRDFGSPVRTNQYGYAVHGPKKASIVNSSTKRVRWRLLDASGAAVKTGRTEVQGTDTASGDHVHIADFSSVRKAGTGYTLAVGDASSYPFAIADNPYSPLRKDALDYFYAVRSGTPIEARYAGDAYARPAGHLGVAPNKGDTDVPCLPGTCDYSLDVQGGWYDAGDQGKYVVNGALAAWQLMDSYERSRGQGDTAGLRDGLLSIPENDNGVPDVLDESRWETEFLLKMQVPAGEPLAGMVHHKIHDLAWTALPTQPEKDSQPRYLHPPSTAATLNLAAAGAQCARVWARYDAAFARTCLTAAKTAWKAALARPDVYAPSSSSVGGGAYADTDVTDEFSWAATELYATTHDRAYLSWIDTRITSAGFSWRDTGALADLTVVRLPSRFPAPMVAAARKRVLAVADGFVRDQRAQGYPNPSLPAGGVYVWGSNSVTANNALVIATAYDITHRDVYRGAVLESLDYLFGRNALNQSFVTGYGTQASHNQHNRIWANQIDPKLPTPPPGSLAGGPDSALQDPVAQQNLVGCAPATCYIDDIYSYSTNEIAINWNSALAWVAGFTADSAR